MSRVAHTVSVRNLTWWPGVLGPWFVKIHQSEFVILVLKHVRMERAKIRKIQTSFKYRIRKVCMPIKMRATENFRACSLIDHFRSNCNFFCLWSLPNMEITCQRNNISFISFHWARCKDRYSAPDVLNFEAFGNVRFCDSLFCRVSMPPQTSVALQVLAALVKGIILCLRFGLLAHTFCYIL